MIAKITRKTKTSTLAISSDPWASPVNPNRAAIPAKTEEEQSKLEQRHGRTPSRLEIERLRAGTTGNLPDRPALHEGISRKRSASEFSGELAVCDDMIRVKPRDLKRGVSGVGSSQRRPERTA
jgi:hypothetical protein